MNIGALIWLLLPFFVIVVLVALRQKFKSAKMDIATTMVVIAILIIYVIRRFYFR